MHQGADIAMMNCDRVDASSDAATVPAALGTFGLDLATDSGVLSEQQSSHIIDEFIECMMKKGGVQKVMELSISNRVQKQEFAKFIDSILPPVESVEYVKNYPIPSVKACREAEVGAIVIQLKYMAFHSNASMNAPPEIATSKKLTERFVVE